MAADFEDAARAAGWPDMATLVARTAETPVASTVHEPFGLPAGPGLFHVKGLQLPAYVQHVAHHLVAQGRPESKAIQMAIGIVKDWAAGHDGHGNAVHPDVQAAAVKAVAEWEAAKAAAHGGKRFNPYHLPVGAGGGEFTTAGGGGGGKGGASKTQASKTQASTGHPAQQAPAVKPHPHGTKQQLLARAHADRQKARELEALLHALEKQQQSHAKAAAAAKAQVAKLKKAGHHSIANKHHVTHHHHASHAQSLKTRIASLRKQIHDLRAQADQLETQAKGMRSFTLAEVRDAGGNAGMAEAEYRAQLTTSSINDLADDQFAYIEPGGSKDSSGKTVPRGLRHFPIHDKAHADNAAALIAQGAKFGKEALPKVKAAQKKYGESSDSGGRSAPAWGDAERRYTPHVVELRAGDGRSRIGGYAIVFGKLSRNLGGFVERSEAHVVNQARSLGWPGVVCRFNHDSNMILGTTGGSTLRLQPDSFGLDYDVDPPLARADIVELVERGDIQFSSFAFRVPAGGDEWGVTDQNYPLRTLHEIQLIDVAPVLDPAYPDATAGLRSLAAAMSAPLEDVAEMAAADELRRFFTRTDRPSFTPPKPKITGAAAMMALMEKKFPELSE
jgi:phage head maturation protease